MSLRPSPNMTSNQAAFPVHVPCSFPTNGMQPNVPLSPCEMTITGFHDFLVGRLEYLSQDARWSLQSTLDRRGWPLHLRSMETVSWQLEPSSAWLPGDGETLMLLSRHGVKIEDIAQLFFEGRTVNECRDKIEMIKAGVPVTSIEETSQQSDNDTEPSDTPGSETAASKPVSPAPSGTKATVTPFTKRLFEVSSRSTTPYIDSRKGWDQADRDTVWMAVQKGLTPRQIQTQHLPFRSESAIQTRMSKERALRGVQATPTKWLNRDNDLVLKLASEGHGFQDIAPRLSRERTPQQIEARYHKLKKQAEDSQMRAKVSLMEDQDEEVVEKSMWTDANGDEGSEYAEETSRAVQTPTGMRTARKTVPSNDTPTVPPKRTPPSISAIRTKLLNSIDTKYLSSNLKKDLRKALGRTSWPTRFMSTEEHKSPLPRNGTRWTAQDTLALGCIRETVPSLPYKLICKFFPGRTEAAIRHQYNTKVNPIFNASSRRS